MIEHGRLIDVTVKNINIRKGEEDFCRLLKIDDIFYAFTKDKDSHLYNVRGFDQDWQFTGFKTTVTPEGQGAFDVDIAFDGEYIYYFPGREVLKYDSDFNLVATTGRFLKRESERITDQNIAVINGKIHAVTEYRENVTSWKDQPPPEQNIPPNLEVARAAHLRVYDKNLSLLKERDLIANVEGAEVSNQYWAMGSGQVYADGYYCVIAQAPIGNYDYFAYGESIGTRQVFILRFDDDFSYVDSKGPLTNLNNDNFWCTGSLYEDGKYYISYTSLRPGEGCVSGPRVKSLPGTVFGGFDGDKGNIRLSIFDEDFNNLTTVDVTNFTVKRKELGITGAAHRSSILKVDNKVYVTYDVAQGDHRGCWVQELFLKD